MFTLPVSASLLLPLAKAVAATLRSLARRPRTGDETLAAMTSKSLLARPLARPGLPSPNDANKGASLSRNSSLAGVVSRPRRRGPATLGPAATRASPPPFGLIPYLVLLSCLALGIFGSGGPGGERARSAAAMDADEERALEELDVVLHSFYTESRKKGLGVQPRKGDVFICTSPKAGTTWMQQICHQLRTKGDMSFEEISNVVPWLETCGDLGIDADAEQVASPRLFKTHAWRPHLNTSNSREAKYIVITRNPEDSAVSFYNFLNGWFFRKDSISMETFLMKMFLKRGKPQTIVSFLPSPSSPPPSPRPTRQSDPSALPRVLRAAGPQMNNPSYWEFLMSWWPHRNDENLLWLWYEDMKADHRGVVKRVAEFLGYDTADDELIDLVVKNSSFAFMKEHEGKFDEHTWKEANNSRCHMPEDAGSGTSKVMNGGRKPRPELGELKDLLQKKWEEVVTSQTGLKNYEELRAACP